MSEHMEKLKASLENRRVEAIRQQEMLRLPNQWDARRRWSEFERTIESVLFEIRELERNL